MQGPESEKHLRPGSEAGHGSPTFKGLLSPQITFISFSHGSEHLKMLLVVGPNFISVLQLYQDPLEGSFKHRLLGVKTQVAGSCPRVSDSVGLGWGLTVCSF